MQQIYGLYCECHSSQVLYVGRTGLTLAARLDEHRRKSRKSRPESSQWRPVYDWIREHGDSNIEIKLLEVVEDDRAPSREYWWMEHLSTPLNVYKGHKRKQPRYRKSDGVPDDVRQKISDTKKGVPQSLEHRANRSAAMKEHWRKKRESR